MSISWNLDTPQDLLAKARRDLQRLRSALDIRNDEGLGDAYFDLAITLHHIRDWIGRSPHATRETKKAAKKYSLNTSALKAFHDIANGLKHGEDNHGMQDEGHLNFAVLSVASGNFVTGKRDYTRRLKITNETGIRREDIIQLAQQGIKDWEIFFKNHNL